MAGTFTAVDLSQLPFPDAVEPIGFETILAEMLADLQARDPAFTALLESDPAMKVLQVCAMRELLMRQRVNEAVKAVSLAYAKGADLDHRGASQSVPRLVLDEGDPDHIPPIPPTYEPDEDYRRRIQLSFEGYSTAGPVGAYIYHALSADGDVLDASCISPEGGEVLVSVLSRTGDGEASSDLLTIVETALNAETVRPLCDTVTVQSAEIVGYAVEATLELFPGPDQAVVIAAATAAAEKYAADLHRIGREVTRAGFYAALMQTGVQNVHIAQPPADIPISDTQASWCTGITLTAEETDD